jgi:hypothetical protein
MLATRPYEPGDRAAAIEELGDARAIDQTSHRFITAEAGAAAGVALWVEPGPGGEPHLGDVKPVNCGQELSDVVSITDSAAGPSDVDYRITGVELRYLRRTRARRSLLYEQRLRLGNL